MKRTLRIFLAVLLSVALFSVAQAGERTRSGKYQGKHSSGSFEQKVSRQPGQKTKDTTWQNDKGQGTRHMERNWDKEKGTGTYSSSTTRPDGKTWQRQIETDKEGETINRTVTTTNPEGKTNTFTQSVTLD